MKKRQWSIRRSTIEIPDAQVDGIEPINSFSREVHCHCPSPPRSRDIRRITMNIAVYVRFSTQRQAQTQTIEQQLDTLRKYHETQGWPWQEEHIFRDDGYSGAKLRGQVLIDFGSRWDARPLIALLSQLLIDLLATTCIRCFSLKNLNEVGVRWSSWIDR